jgi:hypothetical protein
MLRKVECDNIFVLAKSEDITNTESHISMSITESGASHINKSHLPPTKEGRESSKCKEKRQEVTSISSGATDPFA